MQLFEGIVFLLTLILTFAVGCLVVEVFDIPVEKVFDLLDGKLVRRTVTRRIRKGSLAHRLVTLFSNEQGMLSIDATINEQDLAAAVAAVLTPGFSRREFDVALFNACSDLGFTFNTFNATFHYHVKRRLLLIVTDKVAAVA